MTGIRKVAILISEAGFGKGVLRGIARYRSAFAHWHLYRPPPLHRMTKPQEYTWVVKHWKPDGAILFDSDYQSSRGVARKVPVVCLCGNLNHTIQVPRIITDDKAIGNLAARHLLQRGFRMFAYCGFGDILWDKRRCGGFCETIRSAGYKIAIYQPPRRAGKFRHNEQHLLTAWLNTIPKPAGLMACNDMRSLDVLDACLAAGIRVPNDIAILGVDNEELSCELAPIPLSSVVLDAEPAGFAAAQLLDQMMKDRTLSSREIWIQPKCIMSRRSSDIYAVNDPQVVLALQFIKNHARQAIGVSEVAAAVYLSKRTLEKRFRKAGLTPRDEIRRVRGDEIARMLEQTHLSIEQIGNMLGFRESRDISRFFSKCRGISPSLYRKKHWTAQNP